MRVGPEPIMASSLGGGWYFKRRLSGYRYCTGRRIWPGPRTSVNVWLLDSRPGRRGEGALYPVSRVRWFSPGTLALYEVLYFH